VPESSKHVEGQLNRKESGGKVPDCFRCKTKGHAIESCHSPMHYEVCDSMDHIKSHCLMFRGVKMPVIPNGYAVEGLGFFFIPRDGSVKNKMDATTALIRVIEGSPVAQEVVSKLERLIPGEWA
jgi:hypothetical protein